MLKRRQLPSLDLINDALDSSLGRHVGFDGGDAVFRSNVFEQLVRAGLVSNDGEDVAFGSESAMDGCNSDVACGSYYEDRLHDLRHPIGMECFRYFTAGLCLICSLSSLLSTRSSALTMVVINNKFFG